MYTMKDVCDQLGIQYETLRFYCNEGLVPNIKRDRNNYRIFDERNISWLKTLQCLKKCGMSIKNMKLYLDLCLEGFSSIPERKEMLGDQKEYLMDRIAEINECIDFIDHKQSVFDGYLSGEIEYRSNLIDAQQELSQA